MNPFAPLRVDFLAAAAKARSHRCPRRGNINALSQVRSALAALTPEFKELCFV